MPKLGLVDPGSHPLIKYLVDAASHPPVESHASGTRVTEVTKRTPAAAGTKFQWWCRTAMRLSTGAVAPTMLEPGVAKATPAAEVATQPCRASDRGWYLISCPNPWRCSSTSCSRMLAALVSPTVHSQRSCASFLQTCQARQSCRTRHGSFYRSRFFPRGKQVCSPRKILIH